MEGLDVFCVFEGGGAKGVAHVGFLRAIERQTSYRIGGYAGTSAGAIIAALAAAGWKGQELFRLEGKRPRSEALDLVNESLEQKITSLAGLIDAKEWRYIQFLKTYLNSANAEGDVTDADVGEKIRQHFIKWAVATVVVTLIVACWSGLKGSLLGTLLSVVLALIVVLALVVLAYFAGRYRGFASMERPIDIIEKLLRHKIPRHSAKGVTFADVRQETGVTLKIVASDIETGQLKLFSCETTPHTLVARAVAASAAIPLVFQPVIVDGIGIVAELMPEA